MRTLVACLLLILAAVTTTAATGTVFEKPPAAIDGATRYIFKQAGKFPLPLYVFQPPGRSAGQSRPAILFFHGSGWHSGTLVQFVAHARALAQLGIVTAVVEYRVKLDYDATPFDGLADVKSAIRWFRSHAGELGVDPHRVAAAGGSAGAHLALASAVFPHQFDEAREDPKVSSRPDLLLLFAVVTDLSPSTQDPAPNPLFNGRDLELSPAHHLSKGLPPMQIFQGSMDTWALPDRNARFADRVEANGDECDFILFAGRDHFFYNHPLYYEKYPRFTPHHAPNDYDLCLLLMRRFLRAHHFLEERASVPEHDTTAGTP